MMRLLTIVGNDQPRVVAPNVLSVLLATIPSFVATALIPLAPEFGKERTG
jgi:hypothetical protein